MLNKRNAEGTSKATKKPPASRRKKRAPLPGLAAEEVAGGTPPAEVEALCAAVREAGGGVIGSYRDPVGGHWQVLASLPVDRVEPTPFQRDVSAPHAARLADVIGRMGRFLDPIVAVRNPAGGFWTPNGHHRLTAMRSLGARSIVAVVAGETAVAYQILAMNTEKGHNLREKSLEVARMARSLAAVEPLAEDAYALEFEEASYLTLGLAYEKRGRLGGGAYHPVLKRVEGFLGVPLPAALELRADRADRLLALDDQVNGAVAALKERGFTSPYLRAFVVARLNPLRFRRGATMDPDAAIAAMSAAAEKFDPGKVKQSDLAAAPPVGGEEG